ncbi:hypothetical protein CLU79DRAFT_885166 [Phycomyces nitens]|nr:hypothetical protein CLU79DRAFT_885166 [Phycomyces nitens]
MVMISPVLKLKSPGCSPAKSYIALAVSSRGLRETGDGGGGGGAPYRSGFDWFGSRCSNWSGLEADDLVDPPPPPQPPPPPELPAAPIMADVPAMPPLLP